MEYGYGEIEQVVEFMAGIIAIVALVWLAVGVVEYVLRGIALYRMAKNAGHDSPFLAWVPIANNYLLGCFCERAMRCRTGKAWKFSVILPVLDIVSLAVGGIVSPFAGIVVGPYLFDDGYEPAAWLSALVGLALVVVTAVALYNLYWDYSQGRETLYTVLSVIFSGLGQAILLMVIRDRVPVSVQGGGWGQPYPGGYPQGPYQGQGPQPYQSGPYTAGPEQSSQQGGSYTTQWSQPPQAPQYPQPPQAPQSPQPPAGTGTESQNQWRSNNKK